MKIINLFGGPGIGKSSTAAGLFYNLKKQGIEVELVTEYAKDVTWEGRFNLLDDQLYLLAKQNRRLSRLKNHSLQYVITDSPLLLNAVYTKLCSVELDYLIPLTVELFNSYDNINIMLQRNGKYQEVGRSQSEDEAREIDSMVLELMCDMAIPHTSAIVDANVVQHITNLILKTP